MKSPIILNDIRDVAVIILMLLKIFPEYGLIELAGILGKFIDLSSLFAKRATFHTPNELLRCISDFTCLLKEIEKSRQDIA